MEAQEDDDDLKLAKASAGLLSDLERDLPKILWKAKFQHGRKQAHTQVKSRDLDRIISYVCVYELSSVDSSAHVCDRLNHSKASHNC